MTALNRKLLRELGRLKGQVFSIACVFACGVACFVALRGSHASLCAARDALYAERRFADVFVELERAPRNVAVQLEAVAGVRSVQTRVLEAATVLLPSTPEPIRGRVVSLPALDEQALNAIRLHRGRAPEAGAAMETVLLRSFAEAHGLSIGDSVSAVLNGSERTFRIVGVASSPEYVLPIGANSITADARRFAVLWLDADTLRAVFQLEGSFNSAALSLSPAASVAAVKAEVDRVLAPYGGSGAYGRDRQLSNHALEGELLQLQSMSTVLPLIFLGVAAFLVNMVLSRLVRLQEPEIATLKALGYANLQVGLHFLQLIVAVACIGSGVGVGLGHYIGGLLVELYGEFFKFPDLAFHLQVAEVGVAVLVSSLAAALGGFLAVYRAVRLPPAQAMQTAPPARYRRSLSDLLGLARLLGPALHMVVRELERRPLRTGLSVLAIAASTGLSVVGGWYGEALDVLLDTQFRVAMREDLAVSFHEPRPARAVRELEQLPGVLDAEGLRSVPVRFWSGPRSRVGALHGYAHDPELRKPRNRFAVAQALPPSGVVLTDVLAEVLGVTPGDSIRVELLEGTRTTRELLVAGLLDESFGLQGHMRSEALHTWLGQEPAVTTVLLRTEPEWNPVIDERIKQLPLVAGTSRRTDILALFEQQNARILRIAATIITLFAATICVGVVYNNARIVLSARGRELASLRVLGFTRGEVSSALLTELGVQVLLAVPFGLAFGWLLVNWLGRTVDAETYRLPIVVTPQSYVFAAVITLLSAFASALVVRRRIDHLDLIAVLKSRE
jgi:putative ABC transport system permease protein